MCTRIPIRIPSRNMVLQAWHRDPAAHEASPVLGHGSYFTAYARSNHVASRFLHKRFSSLGHAALSVTIAFPTTGSPAEDTGTHKGYLIMCRLLLEISSGAHLLNRDCDPWYYTQLMMSTCWLADAKGWAGSSGRCSAPGVSEPCETAIVNRRCSKGLRF
jgi:hypothetical protein